MLKRAAARWPSGSMLKIAIRGLSTQKENALRRTRYQDGNFRLRERSGRKTWEYRWYEIQIDGSRKRRGVNLGSIQDYPTEAAAMNGRFRSSGKHQHGNPSRSDLEAISFDTLVEHYRMKEMGEDSNKTFATRETYEGYLRKWILPRWRSLSSSRRESGRCRGVAQIASACEWKQGQNSQYDARGLQSRLAVGMARSESHHARSSERQTVRASRSS